MVDRHEECRDHNMQQLYVILRLDFNDFGGRNLTTSVTVTRVFEQENVATREVERLNALNQDKGCRYIMQAGRIK